MGNLYAVTLVSVCWTVTGVGTVLFPMECVWRWNTKPELLLTLLLLTHEEQTPKKTIQFSEWG